LAGALVKVSQDDPQDAWHVLEHLVVPESNDAEAALLDVSGTLLVLDTVLVMLTTIELDDEMLIQA
jgi:hypothetical protein